MVLCISQDMECKSVSAEAVCCSTITFQPRTLKNSHLHRKVISQFFPTQKRFLPKKRFSVGWRQPSTVVVTGEDLPSWAQPSSLVLELFSGPSYLSDSIAPPRLWNSLPQEARLPPSLRSSKQMKSFLFRQALLSKAKGDFLKRDRFILRFTFVFNLAIIALPLPNY